MGHLYVTLQSLVTDWCLQFKSQGVEYAGGRCTSRTPGALFTRDLCSNTSSYQPLITIKKLCSSVAPRIVLAFSEISPLPALQPHWPSYLRAFTYAFSFSWRTFLLPLCLLTPSHFSSVLNSCITSVKLSLTFLLMSSLPLISSHSQVVYVFFLGYFY